MKRALTTLVILLSGCGDNLTAQAPDSSIDSKAPSRPQDSVVAPTPYPGTPDASEGLLDAPRAPCGDVQQPCCEGYQCAEGLHCVPDSHAGNNPVPDPLTQRLCK